MIRALIIALLSASIVDTSYKIGGDVQVYRQCNAVIVTADPSKPSKWIRWAAQDCGMEIAYWHANGTESEYVLMWELDEDRDDFAGIRPMPYASRVRNSLKRLSESNAVWALRPDVRMLIGHDE